VIDRPPAPSAPAGVYVHFPFCTVRCSYCDFPTVAGRDDAIEAYLGALEREILTQQRDAPTDVDTVYLGGGTPSRMTPEQLARILSALRQRFQIASAAEVTIEANPESLDDSKIAGYLECGVTRISLGVQSLDERALRLARRPHDAAQSVAALQRLCSIDGLEVNADLIAGLPGESTASWDSRIHELASFDTDHVSLYLLETDKETPLARAVRAGRTELIDDDRLVDGFQQAVRILGAAGLAQYEISNFARQQRVSRHNLKYWTDSWYVGYGLGAHGYLHGYRRSNLRDLDDYIGRLATGADPIHEVDPWCAQRRIEEALFLGLRLVAGLDLDALGRRYEIDLWQAYAPVWERAVERRLLTRSGGVARLTDRGRLCSNAVFVELIGDSPNSAA